MVGVCVGCYWSEVRSHLPQLHIRPVSADVCIQLCPRCVPFYDCSEDDDDDDDDVSVRLMFAHSYSYIQSRAC